SNLQRLASLDDWLHHYNHHRPHTALDGRTPMHALEQQVSGKHT
ncbi:MAG: integrase core domain-containing protein, partial [Actinomycetota bacterium]|nr:integrase core domain-containing protein [Actinomycetota bacterium]